MKNTFALLTLLFLLGTIPVFADDKKDDVLVTVSGMVCDFCAQSLTKIFNKEDSVNDITVDLDTQLITIDTVEGQELSDDKIKELVKWSGYDLVSITRPE